MTQSSTGSISECFERLVAGDNDAVRQLWNRYFEQLQEVAKNQIGAAPRRAFDEEVVVISVFECLRKGALDGRFAEMRDRTELWKMLVTMTLQKAIDRVRRELSDKRGGGATITEAVPNGSDQRERFRLDELFADEPTLDSLVAMEEEKNRLMHVLRDGSLRQVAVLRLEGYTQCEMAEKLAVTTRTIERKMELIRKTWRRQLDAA